MFAATSPSFGLICAMPTRNDMKGGLTHFRGGRKRTQVKMSTAPCNPQSRHLQFSALSMEVPLVADSSVSRLLSGFLINALSVDTGCALSPLRRARNQCYRNQRGEVHHDTSSSRLQRLLTNMPGYGLPAVSGQVCAQCLLIGFGLWLMRRASDHRDGRQQHAEFMTRRCFPHTETMGAQERQHAEIHDCPH